MLWIQIQTWHIGYTKQKLYGFCFAAQGLDMLHTNILCMHAKYQLVLILFLEVQV